MQNTTSKINGYRSDIDGLRAIAVLAVLFYHADFPYINGGFVGVDIFFVISGYLITGVLLAEYQRNNKINFVQFFFRRTKRIIPTLLAVLFFSTISAIYIFSPERLEKYGGSLSAAILSISNVYFLLESGYFDIDSAHKPLLHTWSLGVEEQFYLIWPVFVYCIARYNLHLLSWFIGVSIASFVAAQIFLPDHSSAVFFLMPFRIFEFGMGAIAFVLISQNIKIKSLVLNEFLFTLGLFFIIYPILFFNKSTIFPGFNAFIPCLGAAICIYTAPLARQAILLQNKLMIKIGLISYSMYLVHWPMIVFYKYQRNIYTLNMTETVSIIALTVIVAVFLFLLVESPIRTIKISNQKLLRPIFILSIGFVGFGVSMKLVEGWAWRPWITAQLSVQQVKDGKELRFKTRQEICTKKGWDKCDDVVPNKVTALVIGDSHAIDAYNAFSKTFSTHNFVLSTLGGCPPHQKIENIVQPGHPDLEKCKVLNLQRHNVDYLKEFSYIVINNLHEWYSAAHLQSYLSFLKNNDIKKVVVVGGYFSLSVEMSELINKFGTYKDKINQVKIIPSADDESMRKITSDFGYLFVSKMDVFCDKQGCQYFDENNIPFTYDKHHLSYEFANRMLSGQVDQISQYLNR